MSEELESRLDELESLVEQQQARIEEQEDTIENQQETIEDQQERLDWLDELDEELEEELDASLEDLDEEEVPDGIDRRSAMKAGGLLALAGLGAGSAGANPTGQVGTSGRPLQTLYSESVVSSLFDFEGSSMFLETFEDNNTDIFAVSSDNTQYSFMEPQFEVDENGDTTVDGSLSVGGDGSEQRTAGPIAKGYVPEDPSSTSPNTVNVNDVSWNSGQGWYEIDIEGVDYDFDQYATVITSVEPGVTFNETSVTGLLLVEPSNGSQTAFNFATYDL